MTLVFNVTNLKYGNYDVLNVLNPLLLSGLDVAKELYVTLNFRLANLLGEHMKTPMRGLQDVMSRFPSSISDRFDKEDHGHKKFF